MKIDLGSVASQYIQNTSSGKNSTSSRAAESRLDQAQDGVRIDGNVSRLAGLKAELADLPDVREARVQELRSAVLGGRYSVSASDIASSMLAEMVDESR